MNKKIKTVLMIIIFIFLVFGFNSCSCSEEEPQNNIGSLRLVKANYNSTPVRLNIDTDEYKVDSMVAVNLVEYSDVTTKKCTISAYVTINIYNYNASGDKKGITYEFQLSIDGTNPVSYGYYEISHETIINSSTNTYRGNVYFEPVANEWITYNVSFKKIKI